jgi:hypothetical protein
VYIYQIDRSDRNLGQNSQIILTFKITLDDLGESDAASVPCIDCIACMVDEVSYRVPR